MWSSEEVAWMAGLIEGEGSIVFTSRTGVCVKVMMNDEDVIRRLATTSGVGAVYGPYANGKNRRVRWVWQVTDSRDVKPLLEALTPWMGSRRSKRIAAALERLAGNRGPRAERTQCKHGHEFTSENTRYVGTGRYCRTCHNLSSKRAYWRQRDNRISA